MKKDFLRQAPAGLPIFMVKIFVLLSLERARQPAKIFMTSAGEYPPYNISI